MDQAIKHTETQRWVVVVAMSTIVVQQIPHQIHQADVPVITDTVSILVKQRAYILALITTPLLQLPLVHLIPIPMEQDHVSVITAMVLAVAPAFKSHRFVKTNMATLLMEVVRPVTVQRAINGIAQRHLVCLYPLNLYRV